MALVVLTVCAFLVQGLCWAKEKEKSVAEKVLDILKSNNQITEEQYKELVAQAQAGFDFADVYLGVKDIPHLGGIRVGHQKEPFSLEEQTSTNLSTTSASRTADEGQGRSEHGISQSI